MTKAMRKQVLLVDNEEDVLVLLEHALETGGYETTTAWSGWQALELLARQNFDLMILDDHLSDLDAEQLLSCLGPRARDIPVIITQNAGSAAECAPRYLALGAGAVACKWRPQEVQTRVEEMLAAA